MTSPQYLKSDLEYTVETFEATSTRISFFTMELN